MKSFFIQKNGFLLLLGDIVVVSASLAYLFTAGNAFPQRPTQVTPTPKVLCTPILKLTQSDPPNS